ncbi:unnamed protein product [Lactuca virosa]|uniref:Uncharacterized protein n=1 Tax=Lactuca virosa TaxID=75947 RepID=A0AAU9P5P3_9ASTR|nr:unnamed protein product [Lactuca virosa]
MSSTFFSTWRRQPVIVGGLPKLTGKNQGYTLRCKKHETLKKECSVWLLSLQSSSGRIRARFAQSSFQNHTTISYLQLKFSG